MNATILLLLVALAATVIALVRSEKGKRGLKESLRMKAEESLNNSKNAEHWKKMYNSEARQVICERDNYLQMVSDKSDLMVALSERDKLIAAKIEEIKNLTGKTWAETELRKVAQTETRHLSLVLAQKTADFEELKMRYDRLLRGVDFKAKKPKPRTSGKKGGVK